MNDLHTATLAEGLAGDLRASFLINAELDRNRVDLNRISQVRAGASWFLALIEDLLGRILDRHGRGEVLIVHGWNVVQPRCDLGIGARLEESSEALAQHPTRTVSARYLRGRLRDLSLLLADAGFVTTYGERYPARHPNNLLQLFRHTASDELSTPRLREWATGGRIEAVQLELGIPLRWPGPQRQRLRAIARDVFADSPVRIPVNAPVPQPVLSHAQPPMALRFHDAENRIGLMAGVDATGTPQRGIQGRILLFLGGDRVALFTGEEARSAHFGGGGPHFLRTASGGFRLVFDGSTLETANGGHYVDLERALSGSVLRPLRVDLVFAARDGDVGMVRGEVHMGERSWYVNTLAFADPTAWRRWSGARRSEWALSVAFADGATIVADSGAPDLPDNRFPPRNQGMRALRISLAPDRYTPESLDFRLADGSCLRLSPTGRISVLRPVARQRSARVTLGIAAAILDGVDQPGAALYEYARLCDP